MIITAAVVRSDGVILGESLASQHEIHAEFGGVVPGLARDAHAERIDGIVLDALQKAGMKSVEEVDAIGVTVGPGLEICLRVGCRKAQALAIQYQKPFVGVHHLEAHILMSRISNNQNSTSLDSDSSLEFPFLALLVSGGHCQILKCMGIGRYTIMGGTIDDSLGEAFDKTSRLLNLTKATNGGPAIEKLAREENGDPLSVPLPIPMQKRGKKNLDLSYAGLKTSIRTHAEKLRKERGLDSIEELSIQDKANLAASFQHIAIKHVEQILERIMTIIESETEKGGEEIKSLAVVGGVAANQELRGRLQSLCDARKSPWKMYVPPPRLCTDQGAMSAWAAIERINVGSTDEPDGHDVYARYPFSNIVQEDVNDGGIS